MLLRALLLLALALVPACAAQGPHAPAVATAPADGPAVAPPRKVDPDPEHVSTGGKVALGMAAGGVVAGLALIALTGIAAAALMSGSG
ncbi:hypothetical protein [Amaricoccus sp.]|uniref:hypothetical protein n=1 Tax=Amaricoccus sp. TaxID=1872485 RepID=UPI001B516D74|nr:hypothetical protein [Amaricoccus sp.]MBP7000082.1 hypothetical protein [Amaricoccus sp.]